MANHLRRQIREAVATAVTGLTTSGARVYQSRVYPLDAASLPCLLISSQQESSRVIDMTAPLLVERLLTLQVSAVARGIADLEDTLDGMCKEVEVALAMPVTALAGLSNSIELVATRIDVDGSGEVPTGRADMQFEIVYFAEQSAPDVAH